MHLARCSSSAVQVPGRVYSHRVRNLRSNNPMELHCLFKTLSWSGAAVPWIPLKTDRLRSYNNVRKTHISLHFVEMECFVLIFCYFFLVPFTHQIIFFLCNGLSYLVLSRSYSITGSLCLGYYIQTGIKYWHIWTNALKNLLKQMRNLFGSLTWWFLSSLAEILLLPHIEQVKWNEN